jgi:hypothetical protein
MNLLDSLLAITVTILLLGIFAQAHMNATARTEQRLAAEQLMQVARGAKAHLEAHAQELKASATASSGPTLPLDDMRREGFLPPSLSGTNIWGQRYVAHVRATTRGNGLRVVVLTVDGRSGPGRFNNVSVPGAAVLAGAGAGYIPSGDVEHLPSSNLTGAAGTWSLPLDEAGIPNPGPGHLGYVSDFDASDLAADALLRVEVPGNPEYNSMETTLDMTGNAISDVGEIRFRDRTLDAVSCAADEDQGKVFLDGSQGLYLCRNGTATLLSDSGNGHPLKDITIVSSGDLVDKPFCAPGTGTVPAIFVAPSIAGLGPEAQPIAAFQAWATNHSDTQWQVHMRLLSSGTSGLDADNDAGNGTAGQQNPEEPLPAYNRILTFTSCAPETP